MLFLLFEMGLELSLDRLKVSTRRMAGKYNAAVGLMAAVGALYKVPMCQTSDGCACLRSAAAA